MDRQLISAIAHQERPIAAPLDDDAVRQLLDRAIRPGTKRVLDLGCGEGAWLLRAMAHHPELVGEGVDISSEALAKARTAIAESGLEDRVTVHQQDATRFTSPHPFDLVLSVGATHAYGGLLPTLAAAAGHLAPGGSVLVGECFWEREPTEAALDALGATPADYDDLATTVDRVMEAGWTPVHGHVSTLREWDDYEWAWTGSLSRWAMDNREHPDSGDALKAANEHRHGWLHGYRGVLGFVTLLLRRTT